MKNTLTFSDVCHTIEPFFAHWAVRLWRIFKKFLIMNNNRQQSEWKRLGLMMWAQASGWIAGPVVAALLVGRWLDDKYDSKPWYFLSLTILAFILSSVGITLVGIRYMKKIEQEDKKLKDKVDQ